MLVTIRGSYTVTPSDTTPTLTLPLSLCDQIKLPNHGSQLYLYTNSINNNNNNGSSSSSSSTSLGSCMHILRTSLSKVLTHYHSFAGRLRWIQGGRLELLCNAKGALLLEATCDDVPFDKVDLSIDIVLHHDPFAVLPPLCSGEIVGEQKLVPKIDYDVPIEEVPLLAIQLTRFPCGSLILGVSLFRALVDGASVGSFMPSWAKLARGESLEDWSLMPALDRTLLDSRRLRLPPRFPHLEFSPPPLWEGSNYKVTKPMYATAILKLTKHQVEKLKKNANKGQQKRYTSFEVISGHLWRCVSKVRNVDGGNWNQPTRLTTLVNCRNRLNPPLPKTYFGNATFPTVTQTCSFDEVVHKPLSYVVGKVREAIEKVSDEYVRSALDFVANQKDLNLLRDTFYNNQFRGRGGDPNLYVVGWTNFPFFETDFGWGKPDCLVPGNVNSDGKAFLLDTRIGDGFIVAICLQASHIDALKKLFYEDIEPVAASKL